MPEISTQKIESFLARLNNFAEWDPKKQTDYFAYFLTVEDGVDELTAKQLGECFDAVSLKRYSRLRAYLSEEANKPRGGRYLKTTGGYTLERSIRDAIRSDIENEPEKIKVAEILLDLLKRVSDQQEHSFLQEALNCYRVKAFRASIVLVWILTLYHLRKYILSHKLVDFNSALASNTDKRIRISLIRELDDFSEIPDDKFLELCRIATVISNDVRKILAEKLGIRNSAAHPAGIEIGSHKATEFISDLVNNVILKY